MSQGSKQYKYLWRKMLDYTVIDLAFKNLRKHKTNRPEIINIELHYEEERAAMHDMILNTRPGEVPNPEKAFVSPDHVPVRRYEHGKWRTTYKPGIHEQWLHHIIAIVLQPIIERTAYPFYCGSLPKKGAHYGMRQLRRKIAKGKNIKYFAKLDIRHFFDSIRMDIMIRELASRIKDDWFLYIIRKCYEGFSRGLVLGFYLSQWLANYLLEPLDKMITDAGYDIYFRYMDDIVVFGPNKRKLHALIVEIKKLLGRRFRLKLKNNYQVNKFIYKGKGQELDFMGFIFGRNKVVIRKRIMLKATHLAKRIWMRKQAGGRVYKRHAQAMISYMGWFTYTDSYSCYLKYIKPYITVKRLKQLVSRLDKKENRHKNDRMERGALLTAAG